jgi:hypothetical protein
MESTSKYRRKHEQCLTNLRRAKNSRRKSKWWFAQVKWAGKFNRLVAQDLPREPDPRCGYPPGFLYPAHPFRRRSD